MWNGREFEGGNAGLQRAGERHEVGYS